MTIVHIATTLTGERTMTKYTGGRDRPSRDEIARLAYHFYETRGRRDGRDLEDWLSAEQQLTRHYAPAGAQTAYRAAKPWIHPSHTDGMLMTSSRCSEPTSGVA